MSDEFDSTNEDDLLDVTPLEEEATESAEGAETPPMQVSDRRTALGGMFRNWYLEYASYVILERAVPHIDDGLKPVQRRILHSMQTLDNGHFQKVANLVGNTMKYHPHGDASIKDAMVQLGQRELLIDTQGNWGNILTGDSAAAGRYIEARLSEFALETVYSPKITDWMPSYDGTNREPVTLPVKFPLLLVQGVEGIAVGLSSKILPHNFNEVADAAIAYLNGEPFELLPDFQTGGFVDVSRYNDGARGGAVKVRAKIEKIDNKTLAITELPFGKTTPTLIASILTAMEKGLIKIRKVEDHTAAEAKIIVHLIPGSSSDKAIDALYAFTGCEESVSPNCCVISDNKPLFLTVSDLLRHSVSHTRDLLRREQEIKLGEAREEQLFCSLERIFIQERIYKDKELEQAPDMPTVTAHIDKRLEPFKPSFFRPVTEDDILKLWEIKMGRILKFNADKAEKKIAALNDEIARIEENLKNITGFTVKWFEHLKEAYGDRFPRRTQIRGFDSIQANKVAEANKRLHFDPQGNFIGTGLKEGDFLFTCSDMDDILVFFKNGTYKLMKVQDKLYLGKDQVQKGGIVLFKKGDKRTIYNVIYQNGKNGPSYKKRFFVTGLTRDKEYNVTKGLPGSSLKYFSVNPNGEAEVVTVHLKPGQGMLGMRRMRVTDFDVNFADLDIKGKEALGNLVTKAEIRSVTLKETGASTLGGREVWFDKDVLRLNYDGRGSSLGIFEAKDQVLVVTKDGEYYTTSFSDHNHYPDNILRIEKFDPHKVWTLVFRYADAGNYPYIKRFVFEAGIKPQRFVGTDEKSALMLLSDTVYPRLQVTFGGHDSVRQPLEIDAEEFIAVKGFKAKGKRISTFEVSAIDELEPLRFPPEPEPAPEPEPEVHVAEEPAHSAPEAIQPSLFDGLDDEGDKTDNTAE